MKHKMIIPLLLAGLLGLSAPALAGFDPTPFTPEVNKLGAIENSLNSISERIRAVLAIPPNDQTPAPVNRIHAMDHQLSLLTAFMASTMDEIIDAVMAIPPDDQLPVIDALNAISAVLSNESEMGIYDVADTYLGLYPDAALSEALTDFSLSAKLMLDNAQEYIDDITTTPIPCPGLTEAECVDEAPRCVWVIDPGYCTDPLP